LHKNQGNEMINILFVCIHNSARSQMAEAFFNSLGIEGVKAQSAGLEEGKLNPVAVEAMKEVGIDISKNKTKTVYGFLKEGKHFHYIITVCDATSGERCPIFPGNPYKRLHWSFDDPSSFEGTFEEKLERTRTVRDEIKAIVEEFAQKLRKK
jgi:arsenate reductase (thioredoxin)